MIKHDKESTSKTNGVSLSSDVQYISDESRRSPSREMTACFWHRWQSVTESLNLNVKVSNLIIDNQVHSAGKSPNSISLIIDGGVGIVIATDTLVNATPRCSRAVTIIAKQTAKDRTMSDGVSGSRITTDSSTVPVGRRPRWRCGWGWSNLSRRPCWIRCRRLKSGSQKLYCILSTN